MYYEINVSKNMNPKPGGEPSFRHYFATAPRSLTSQKETQKMLSHFQKLFPSPDYKISVSMNPEQSYHWDLEIFLELS
jgi:hypothetical protein